MDSSQWHWHLANPFYFTLSSTVYTNTTLSFIANNVQQYTSIISCTFNYTASTYTPKCRVTNTHAGRQFEFCALQIDIQILLGVSVLDGRILRNTFMKVKYFVNTSETILSMNRMNKDKMYVWSPGWIDFGMNRCVR